jgi:hypothetical protein
MTYSLLTSSKPIHGAVSAHPEGQISILNAFFVNLCFASLLVGKKCQNVRVVLSSKEVFFYFGSLPAGAQLLNSTFRYLQHWYEGHLRRQSKGAEGLQPI